MRVLAIDTPGREGAVALLAEGQLVAGAELGASQEHAERVLVVLEQLLARQEWQPADLDLVVVSLGPGSFTGVRVGIAAGQGISFGLGKPLIGVPSLEVLAAWSAQVMEGQGGLYVPLLDARRGELYTGAWRPVGGAGQELEPVLPPLAVAPEELTAALAGAAAAAGPGPIVFCGDGVPIAAHLIAPSGGAGRPGDGPAAAWPRPIKTVFPPRPLDAATLLSRLGERRFARDGAPALVEPLYVRLPDARKPARRGETPQAAGRGEEPAAGGGGR